MIYDDGNAYKLDGDVLMSAPLDADGLVAFSDWCEVDFDRIDSKENTYLMSIRVALTAQARR